MWLSRHVQMLKKCVSYIYIKFSPSYCKQKYLPQIVSLIRIAFPILQIGKKKKKRVPYRKADASSRQRSLCRGQYSVPDCSLLKRIVLLRYSLVRLQTEDIKNLIYAHVCFYFQNVNRIIQYQQRGKKKKH